MRGTCWLCLVVVVILDVRFLVLAERLCRMEEEEEDWSCGWGRKAWREKEKEKEAFVFAWNLACHVKVTDLATARGNYP